MDAKQEDIQYETIISGFIGFCDTWEFMLPSAPFVLPENVTVDGLKMNSFQGMDIVSGVESMIEASLGSYSGHSLWQVVLTPKVGQIFTANVSKEFVAAVDEALKTLEGRETINAWPSECCSTFAEVLECSACSGAVKISIAAEDIVDFGAAFNTRFSTRLQDLHPDCTTFTVVRDFNQHSLDSFAEVIANYYNGSKFTELAIHFGRDYSSSGNALFWNREAVVGLMRANPKQEYYPAYLNGLGSFWFTLNPENDAGPKISTVKFTSKLFQIEAKQYKDRLFSRPFFADFLVGNKTRQFHRLKATELKWFARFNDLFENYVKEDLLLAHCEAVVSMRNTTENALQQMIELFESTFGAGTRNLLKSFTMEAIKSYLDLNMMPPFETLHELVNKKIEGFESESTFVPSLDEIKLASVCEATICFGINGSAVGPAGKALHPEQLLCDFGLQTFNFRNGQHLKGLANLTNVCVVAEKLLIVQYTKVPLYTYNVFFNVNCKNQKILENSLAEMKGRYRVGKICKRMAIVFWNVMETFIFDTFFAENELLTTLEAIADTVLDKDDLHIKSATELMEFLNSPECPDLKICTQFLKLLKSSMTLDQYDRFMEACAMYIDNQLYAQSDLLLFPVRCESYEILVLPVRKTKRFEFESMNENDRNVIFRHYETVYRKLYEMPITELSDWMIDFQNQIEDQPVSLTEVFEYLHEKNVENAENAD